MYLSKMSPDKIVLLGDRLETLLAAISAYTLNIPIIHIGGGEITEGSVDDSYRHCITKLSSFHLVSNNIYKRIIKNNPTEKLFFNVIKSKAGYETNSYAEINKFCRESLYQYMDKEKIFSNY